MDNMIAVNGKTLSQLQEELNKASKEVERLTTEIFDSLISIGRGDEPAWTGMAYNTFLSNCFKFKPSMEALSLTLQAFATLCGGTITDAGEKYEQDVKNAQSNAGW